MSAFKDVLSVFPKNKFLVHGGYHMADFSKEMDFAETDEDIALLRESISELANKFSDDYWRGKDEAREFPKEFFQALAQNDWLKLNIPKEYGGAQLGMVHVAEIIHGVAQSPGGVVGADLLMASLVFAGQTLMKFGKESVKEKYLRGLSEGKIICSFCLTEPNAGVNTPEIETFASFEGGGYLISGQKVWITLAHLADLMIVVARTAKREDVARRTDGITVFAVDAHENSARIRTKKIQGTALRPLTSSEVFFDNAQASESDILGERGKGWEVLSSLLNTERISTASMSIGVGEMVLEKAITYAKQRKVFGRPIGTYQGIQFPLAECKVDLEAAWLMTKKAAWLYDQGNDCAFEANAAAFLGAKAANFAVDRAMQTFGGTAFAISSNLERHWRDLRLFRSGPVPEEMVLNYIAQHVLGMPRAY
jgi:acyl-CoA dehydrogenase